MSSLTIADLPARKPAPDYSQAPVLAVNVPTAARMIGISPDWVYALVHEGTIACIRTGPGNGRIVIPVDALQAYIDSRPRLRGGPATRGRSRKPKNP